MLTELDLRGDLVIADDDSEAQRQAVIGPRHTVFLFSDSNAKVLSDLAGAQEWVAVSDSRDPFQPRD